LISQNHGRGKVVGDRGDQWEPWIPKWAAAGAFYLYWSCVRLGLFQLGGVLFTFKESLDIIPLKDFLP
jgi:hypothetical protein